MGPFSPDFSLRAKCPKPLTQNARYMMTYACTLQPDQQAGKAPARNSVSF
jgi:hypothetical protein